jgi:pimeloyl-ACP methyl ester carboxylesterase
MNVPLPCLEHWPAKIPSSKPIEPNPTETPPVETPQRLQKAVVFVHGVLSGHETFTEAREYMAGYPGFSELKFYYFDYDFTDAIDANGQRFAKSLCNIGFREGDEVAIVAHSMGGLVTRLAILSKPLPFIKIVFLIGTPNGGAVRLAQLSGLMQLVHGGVNRFFALFPRWSGIVSLSSIEKLIETKRDSFSNALDIDYISIPGRYFHPDRSIWEIAKHASGVGFSGFEVFFLKILHSRLERAHDGIVEEVSNDMTKCSRSTEKLDSYGDPQGANVATYAHLTVNACNDVNHIQIHHDPVILNTISDLIAAKFSLNGKIFSGIGKWVSEVDRAERLKRGLKISPKS